MLIAAVKTDPIVVDDCVIFENKRRRILQSWAKSGSNWQKSLRERALPDSRHSMTARSVLSRLAAGGKGVESSVILNGSQCCRN
jgi:hypothetical protein